MKYLIKRALMVCALLAAPVAALAAEGFATSNVNLRSGPSTAYPPVIVVPEGSTVNVYGCLAETPWCDVSYGRIRGWMSGRYIQTVYRQRRVYVDPQYYRPLGIPVIRFDLDNYWERNYRQRDFYRDRDRWRREWRRDARDPDMGRDRDRDRPRWDRDNDRPRRDRDRDTNRPRWNDNDSGWNGGNGWNDDDFGNRPNRQRDRDRDRDRNRDRDWNNNGQWGGSEWNDGQNNNRPRRPRPDDGGQNNGGQWGGNQGNDNEGGGRPRPRPDDGGNSGGVTQPQPEQQQGGTGRCRERRHDGYVTVPCAQ